MQTALDNKVTLNTNQTITGEKIFNNYFRIINGGSYSGSGVAISNPNITKGIPPSTVKYNNIGFYGSAINSYTDRIGLLEVQYDTDNAVHMRMQAINSTSADNTNACTISCNVDSSGNFYTYAPTPAASDNSSKIATTAFVNNRLPCASGTWTPVLKGSSTAGAFTYTAQSGNYVKFGNMVYIIGYMSWSACTTVPAGDVRIDGLPFTAIATSGLRSMSILARCNGLDNQSLQKIFGLFVVNNSTQLSCRVMVSNSTIGINAYSEAVWSTTSSDSKYIKVTATTYIDQGISFAGWYKIQGS